MDITIRPFEEDADYDRLEATEKLIIPDEWDSADYYRNEDQQQAPHPAQRWLVFDGDRPIGNAEYLLGHWWDEPDQYIFYLGVIPAYQGMGVGKQLLETVMTALQQLGAKSTLTWVRDDYPRAIRFLEDRGYAMIQRDAQSELIVSTFDPTPFDNVLDRLNQHRISLHSIDELQQSDPNWVQKLYDIDWPIRLDVPGTEKKKQEPLEDWRARKFDTPYLLPEGFIVAVTDDGDYVGYSAVYKASSDEPTLKTNVTGVVGAWRRKGIATAMKLQIIAFAKVNGYAKIVTENEENNPMYALNMALGFRPIPAWLTYKKVL
jgi:GNAT superfamily N-acetyltransferase